MSLISISQSAPHTHIHTYARTHCSAIIHVGYWGHCHDSSVLMLMVNTRAHARGEPHTDRRRRRTGQTLYANVHNSYMPSCFTYRCRSNHIVIVNPKCNLTNGTIVFQLYPILYVSFQPSRPREIHSGVFCALQLLLYSVYPLHTVANGFYWTDFNESTSNNNTRNNTRDFLTLSNNGSTWAILG